jgi:geranylgeranyl pyrophosphate synthase
MIIGQKLLPARAKFKDHRLLNVLVQAEREMLPCVRRSLRISLPGPPLARLRQYVESEWSSAIPIRGFLLMAGYEYSGKSSLQIVEAAAAIELAQVASLIVDDVIDNSELRGGPSALKTFGPGVSFLAGDVLKAAASVLMTQSFADDASSCRRLEAMHRFEAGYRNLCVGQLLDLKYERAPLITEHRYLEMIKLTTGSLMEAAIRVGAILGRVDAPIADLLGQYAGSLGMAFQIYDDVLDLLPHAIKVKPFANDIRRRKQRLPMITYLASCSSPKCSDVLRSLSNGAITSKQLRALSRAIIDSGALQYALGVGKKFSLEAIRAAKQLPDGQHRGLLLDLVDALQPHNDDLLSTSWQRRLSVM